MKKSKLFISLVLVIAVLAMQIGAVFAAPSLAEGTIAGKVIALECGTDSNENTIILVTVEDSLGASQTVGISLETAKSLGLVTLGEGDVPDCSVEAFAAILAAAPEEGLLVEIAAEDIVSIPQEPQEPQHPVGAALAAFFEDITDYDTIMSAHEEGTGFGVLAQALWLTKKLDGDSAVFLAIIEAKKTGDYSAFALEDGTILQNWGQFKKALMQGDKKTNLGAIMSEKAKEKSNNGNGNSNNANNGNGSEKDKNKDKGKNKDK